MPFGWFKRNRTAPVETPVAVRAEAPTETPDVMAETHREDVTPVTFPAEKIAARAYEIWVRRGKPPHAELQNWLDAEAELRAEYAANPEPGEPIRKPR
jgi:hypothetical protein